METSPGAGAGPAVWKPPVIGVGSLFGLFVVAMLVRRSPIAEAARGAMVVVSTAVGVGTAVYGLKMAVDTRVRGWGSALGGVVMVGMGAYSTVHVVSSALKRK